MQFFFLNCQSTCDEVWWHILELSSSSEGQKQDLVDHNIDKECR